MRYRRLLPALLAAFALAAPALAQPQGYWAVAEAPDGIKLGIIFPDYSPNEFAGLGFVCSPGVETAQGWSDVGEGLKGGAKTSVAIEAGEDVGMAAFREPPSQPQAAVVVRERRAGEEFGEVGQGKSTVWSR